MYFGLGGFEKSVQLVARSSRRRFDLNQVDGMPGLNVVNHLQTMVHLSNVDRLNGSGYPQVGVEDHYAGSLAL